MMLSTALRADTLACGLSLPEDIDLVIFDFDGVIADSEVISLTSLQEALSAYDIHMPFDDVRSKFLGRSLAVMDRATHCIVQTATESC